MDTLLKVVRWVLGLLILIFALAAVTSKVFSGALIMLAGMLVILPPSGAWFGQFLAPVARHGSAIGIGLLLFFAGVVIFGFGIRPETSPVAHAPAVVTTPKAKARADTTRVADVKPAAAAAPDVSAKINRDGMMLIEGQGWDKTRIEWGSDGVKHLNAAMPKAAEKAAQSPSCDYVEIVGLSDRSRPKKLAVFFIDCRNGQRFYINEADLKSDKVVVSKNAKTSAISDTNAVAACEDSVKSQLYVPQSFDRDLLNTSVYRAPTGNLVVTFTFQAKNALGAELPQRARCVIDDTGIHPAELSAS